MGSSLDLEEQLKEAQVEELKVMTHHFPEAVRPPASALRLPTKQHNHMEARQ